MHNCCSCIGEEKMQLKHMLLHEAQLQKWTISSRKKVNETNNEGTCVTNTHPLPEVCSSTSVDEEGAGEEAPLRFLRPAGDLLFFLRPPGGDQVLTTCPVHVSCLVPGFRWVMVTSTAWTFSCLGGMEQTL